MRKYVTVLVGVVCLAAGHAAAQSAGTRAGAPAGGSGAGKVGLAEIPGLVRQLSDVSTRAAASARLMLIEPEGLVPMHDVLDSQVTSAGLKEQLKILLPKVHAKLAAGWKAKEAENARLDEQSRIDQYMKVGKRSAKWDGLVVAAFKDLASREGFGAESGPKFKAALDAGCTDPYVRYYYLTRSDLVVTDDLRKELDQVAKDMNASDYSAAAKYYAYMRMADHSIISAARADAVVKRMTELLPGILKDPQCRRDVKKEATEGLIAVLMSRQPTANRKAAFDQVLPIVQGAMPGDPLPEALAVWMYSEWAWDARGSGSAFTVTEDGGRLFRERLDLAEGEARKVFAKYPTDPMAPTEMIQVCMGRGAPDEEMERWFQRAMWTDPDNYEACHARAYSLTPRWGGSAEELLAFGRTCVKMGSGTNRIPTIQLYGYNDLTQSSDGGLDLLTLPQTWKDMQAMFEKLLADPSGLKTNRERTLRDRADYLEWAYKCQKWSEFVRLSREFGADVDVGQIGSQAVYDAQKRQAQEHAGRGN